MLKRAFNGLLALTGKEFHPSELYLGWLHTRLWPLASLIVYILFRAPIRPWRGMALLRYRGTTLALPPEEFPIFREVFVHSMYDRAHRVDRDNVVIDVGAHIGTFSVRAAKAAGENGTVVAVEPGPDQVAVLSENVRLNGLTNVVVVPRAAGSRPGTGKLFLTDRLCTYSTINATDRAVDIRVDTLDSIVRELELPRVDFIKIDAEGAELDVLVGAKSVLSQPGVKLCIAAYHKLPDGTPQLAGILSYLESLGASVVVDWETTPGSPLVYAVTGQPADVLS
ncbi:MAG: FkbM family methyltransferase [Dehalococcoidia bacterium]|nr:FkbM family methyltransferase [Dehalococcoidia bacterium]